MSGVHTLVASAMNHDALLYPYVRVDIDGSWVNADQYAKAIAAIREQAKEIERLIKLRDDWCNEYTKVRDEFAAFRQTLGAVQ